jgi:excinuclease ABC subunit A
MSSDAIEVVNATTHNLRGVSCSLPHRRLTVVTGLSGAGKSSLAFDTVYAEGQRRYLQTFSTYVRSFLDRMPRPPVDRISHLVPCVALPQHNPVTQPRSTVATVTELSAYLALLLTAVGRVECATCARPVWPTTPADAEARLLEGYVGQRVLLVADVRPEADEGMAACLARLLREGHARALLGGAQRRIEELGAGDVEGLGALPVIVDRLVVEGGTPRLRDSLERALQLGEGSAYAHDPDGVRLAAFYADWRCDGCGEAYVAPTPPLFSPQTPLGACPRCAGYGRAMGIDWAKVVPDPSRSVAGGAVEPLRTPRGRNFQIALEQLCLRHDVDIDRPWRRLDPEAQALVRDGDPVFGGVRAFFDTLAKEAPSFETTRLLSQYRAYTACEPCRGTGLSSAARAVRLRGHDLGDLLALDLEALRDWFGAVELDAAELARAGEVPAHVRRRLDTLVAIGLGYLPAGRQTRTLSAGEYQRIQLSGCLDRGLVDTCYVLDEPTAGLHPRDSARLLRALEELRDLGNTLVVVEHELALIEAADHVVELGPGAGEGGGRVIFEGPPRALAGSDTPTGRALAERGRRVGPPPLRPDPAGWIRVRGARSNNLRDADADLPIGRLSAVTGVSGSGKSSLVFDVLLDAARRATAGDAATDLQRCDAVEGLERFRRVVAMDRDTLAPGVRSTILTSSGVLEPLRVAFAATEAARERGLTPMHFSANVRGGRCERCEGLGFERVDMHFMADVEVPCEACEGRRFQPRVLEVRLRGASIHELHELSVDQALRTFGTIPEVRESLAPIAEVGLGYARLGQPVRALSGGERQRLRIAKFLAEGARADAGDPDATALGATLYLFDEPSVGLHAEDVAVLARLFRRMTELGDTVVVVEHDLALVAACDWVVDLGPEAGRGGGALVVQGPPPDVARHAASHTGAYLSRVLAIGDTLPAPP